MIQFDCDNKVDVGWRMTCKWLNSPLCMRDSKHKSDCEQFGRICWAKPAERVKDSGAPISKMPLLLLSTLWGSPWNFKWYCNTLHFNEEKKSTIASSFHFRPMGMSHTINSIDEFINFLIIYQHALHVAQHSFPFVWNNKSSHQIQ